MSAEVGENAVDIALKVAIALTSVGAEYFVGGSLASSLQGEPRATNDIDFVISLPAGQVNALRDALGQDFEVDADMLRDAVLHARSANAFYLPVVTKIDFFGRGYEPFDESEFSRRRAAVVRASGESLVVKSAEDTVLRKLLWFREAARSPRSSGATSCPSSASARVLSMMPTWTCGRHASTSQSCSRGPETRGAPSYRVANSWLLPGAPLSENGKRDDPTKQAIHRFQRGAFPDCPAEQSPLPEGDFFGVDGRRALFLAYAKRITRSPIEAERFAPIGGASSMGCGEFNSLSLSQRDAASRRVNVFLFDPVAEPQNLPCKLRQLAPCRANLDPPPTQLDANGRAPFRCRVFQGLASKCSSQPSPDLSHDIVLRFPLQLARADQLPHKYTLEADDGTLTLERTLGEDGRANDDALVELAFEHLPETHRYRLTCDDGESPPYTVFDFSTLQELQNNFLSSVVAVDLQIPAGALARAAQPASAVAADDTSSNSSSDDDEGDTA